jgi:hypothetical protein
MVLTGYLTAVTERNPVRKTRFPQMLKTGIVGRKLTVEIINCVP